jgi:phage terminase large subunit GpA-like protein
MAELEFTPCRSSALSDMSAVWVPPKQITPAQWAADNLIVPDGPRSGEKWDPTLTPYVVEPLDNMGPDSPVNKQAIQKSAQTGFTVMAIAGAGHSIDCDPVGGMLLVQPTDAALDDFMRDKLNPAIEQSTALRTKVLAQLSRSNEGSTTYNRRYPGGSLALVIANSTADLRSKTKRRIIKDEASEYPDDLDGQGSPHAMIEARRESFLRSADWKETNISTPTIKGGCYITGEYEAGDQRHWHVRCPGCDGEFYFKFGPQFRFKEVYPFDAHYVAPCCGTIIDGADKFELIKHGRWRATAPGPGRYPSYHFDALSSPFVPWNTIAERWIKAQGDPSKLKAFYNLTLGEAYEIKGDAPDHVRLYERREDYPQNKIPPRGLMLTGYADVQLRGIYYEIVAWAPNRESWVIDAGVCVGDTTNANSGAFLDLAKVYGREYADAFGGERRVDGFGVDSGFHTNAVYDWCRARHLAFACKGQDGWHRPALAAGALQDITLAGKKVPFGVQLWHVGTWPLKGHWYEDLRREGHISGQELDPPGYCHFGKFLDNDYFRQITSEYLATRRIRGRETKFWDVRGKEQNHWLDCRIGNMAIADHLGLSRMTEDEWKALARERAGALLDQGDMFISRPLQISAAAMAVRAAQSSAAPAETAVTDLEPAPALVTEAVQAAREPALVADDRSPAGWLGDTSGWLTR